MAVNSYRSVVLANEANSSARTAIAYIREEVRQHDSDGAVTLDTFDGVDCIKMSEGSGFNLYIYEYDGYLMELEAKDTAGATADFGNKIMEVNSISFSQGENGTINVQLEDSLGAKQDVVIGVKSKEGQSNEE